MAARRLPIETLPEQPEDDFQASVISLLRLNGWPDDLIYHTFDSRRSTAGFPDLVAVKPADGRLLVAELKRESGDLSTAQKRWVEALDMVRHFDVRVWKPSDLDEIARLVR